MPEDLFEHSLAERFDSFAPLAARMRPRDLDEFVGQAHILGPGAPLRSLIESDRLTSAILWGPPGSGKTSIAQIVAQATESRYVEISAVGSGVAEVRKHIAESREVLGAYGRQTILFIDEIHRFNKAQQDALLKAVENNWVTLIGATTENPFFEVNPPLLSRSLLFHLEPLSEEEVREIVGRALADSERGVGGTVEFDEGAIDHIVDRAGGDARFALNAVEVGVARASAEGESRVTLEMAEEVIQQRLVRYDKAGDTHYDVISAFIKSLRGSDPDAAVWWLTRMLEAGEDPRFIARRMVIFASEDVGNADPMALMVAAGAVQALEFVGLPEAALNLSQAATYLASAPKSNASTVALSRARRDLESKGPGEVPEHLRDSHHPGAEKAGSGTGYRYPHDFPGAWVEQQYLPEHLGDSRYYEPTDRGTEAEIGERLRNLSEPRGERGSSKR
jgi:putative ATPase